MDLAKSPSTNFSPKAQGKPPEFFKRPIQAVANDRDKHRLRSHKACFISGFPGRSSVQWQRHKLHQTKLTTHRLTTSSQTSDSALKDFNERRVT